MTTGSRLMDGIGCGELAGIIDGELHLGAMPPLGGRWEPIGEVTTRCEEVTDGSLYWAVESEDQGAHRLSEAFLRGARGVVTTGAATPFDGSFLIHVADPLEGLCQFGRWMRSAFEGKLILVGPDISADHVSAFFGDEQAGSRAKVRATISEICDAAKLLASLSEGDFAVFSIGRQSLSIIDEISHLCCPHVVCINSLPHGEQAYEAPSFGDLQALLPDKGCVVLISAEPRNVTVNNQPPTCTDLEWSSMLADSSLGRDPLALACFGIATALDQPLDQAFIKRLQRFIAQH